MEQQIVQIMAQLVELQRDNLELRRELLRSRTETTHAKPPERPSVGLDISESQWALFIDSWNRYKNICRLTEPNVIRNELRAACTDEVNRLLFELIGPESLNTATENYMLQQIRLITVKGLHKEVQRQIFHSMVQKRVSLSRIF